MLAVTPPIVWLAALTGGTLAVAYSLVSLQVALFFAIYLVLTRRIVGACFQRYLAAFAIPTIIALTMALVIIILQPLFHGAGNASLMLINVLIGAISYVALMRILQKKVVQELMQLLRGSV